MPRAKPTAAARFNPGAQLGVIQSAPQPADGWSITAGQDLLDDEVLIVRPAKLSKIVFPEEPAECCGEPSASWVGFGLQFHASEFTKLTYNLRGASNLGHRLVHLADS
jgi:hypothetical protein